jgi:hypothetical protein
MMARKLHVSEPVGSARNDQQHGSGRATAVPGFTCKIITFVVAGDSSVR